ncbi:MAG: OmpA family protein [Spirochaetes bacterium]|nr:OmpA family protein [Spirochaetota bacterium]
MKKSLFIVSSLLMISVLVVACSSSQQTEPGVQDVKYDSNAWVYASNKSLASYPVKGFGYKDSNVPTMEWNKWATAAAPIVNKIVGELPDGYVLQVTGHTDSRGPETAMGNKPGNLKISSDRARNVHNLLKAKGVTSPKVVSKGVGSSEPMSGIATDDPQQRRVTFQVVPK